MHDLIKFLHHRPHLQSGHRFVCFQFYITCINQIISSIVNESHIRIFIFFLKTSDLIKFLKQICQIWKHEPVPFVEGLLHGASVTPLFIIELYLFHDIEELVALNSNVYQGILPKKIKNNGKQFIHLSICRRPADDFGKHWCKTRNCS